MPFNLIKKSIKMCIVNKPFFAFLLVLLFICNYLIDLTDSTIVIPIIINILIWGYGLQVTEVIINGGTRLPKILPRKVLVYGLKGYFVAFFYYTIVQGLLLVFISEILGFPVFEIEELVLNYQETIHLFFAHDPISWAIFVISGVVIVYFTAFFMELAMARLADGGKVKNAFNFPRIKRAIDIIGWKNYVIDYTKIIVSILILMYLMQFEFSIEIVDTIVDTIGYFLIFIIEFVGVGHIYKVYIDNKSKTQN